MENSAAENYRTVQPLLNAVSEITVNSRRLEMQAG